MTVKLIVAVDLDFGIGKNNDLMWHLPADMRFFKETTQGHVVVMGRKNYESIPEKYRPLPNRENVVLTRNPNFEAKDCLIFSSLENCLEHYKNEQEKTIFIIGGGQIYEQALKLNCIDEMLITHVNERFDADTFFPKFDTSQWKEELILENQRDEKNSFSFKVRKYLPIK